MARDRGRNGSGEKVTSASSASSAVPQLKVNGIVEASALGSAKEKHANGHLLSKSTSLPNGDGAIKSVVTPGTPVLDRSAAVAAVAGAPKLGGEANGGSGGAGYQVR